MTLEQTILSNLITNEIYARQALPYIKSEYFHDNVDKKIFNTIDAFIQKYNNLPSKEAILIDLSKTQGLSEEQYKSCVDTIDSLSTTEPNNMEWLIDQTELFCQDKAIYNGIMESIKILDDKTGAKSKGSIPQILSDALGVSFDNSIGHDFIVDVESRYEFYHRKEMKIPFDLDYLNRITGGGLPRKTLNILLASTGVGKSLFMCHMGAANLMDAKNVLYITLEMAEERIAERIDANLMDVDISDLRTLPYETYKKKIDRIKEKSIGRLIIKEYPTATAGSANFRHLLNELKLKKNFVPDIIYIDYLNICSSSRVKQGANVNSYTYVKSIAEELRGLAVEFDVPIVSATQTNRDGFDNSDIGMTNTSESIGLAATVDFMIALIVSDELKALNQIMVKQLKNRYNDPDKYKRFVLGVDKSKMKLYDAEEIAQKDIVDDTPTFDRTSSGEKFNKDKFKGFN